jgi:hypothetical protein
MQLHSEEELETLPPQQQKQYALDILVELLLQLSRSLARPLVCVMDPLEAADSFSVSLLQLTQKRFLEPHYTGRGLLMCVGCRPVHHASRRFAQYSDLMTTASESKSLLRIAPLKYSAFVKFVHDFLSYQHDYESKFETEREEAERTVSVTVGEGEQPVEVGAASAGADGGSNGNSGGSEGLTDRDRLASRSRMTVPRRASLTYASLNGIQAEQTTPLSLVYKGTFVVGDRVTVVKDGTQYGKCATVTNCNWNSLIKVLMDRVDGGAKAEKSYRRDELKRIGGEAEGKASAVPHEVLDYLWQIGRGNPLYTKELLWYLLEER